ncbi:MAG: lasso peptide biosynthesis B2 protein [bacterium]|nr:lasso peptide biosynthesis B2 protein [bacterium]
MRQVAAFCALSWSDRRLLIEAFATLVLVRVALHAWTIERLRRWAGRLERGAKPVDRIVWAVRTASRWTPGTTCLGSALALQRLLSAEGYVSELHIGIARQQPGLVAHAWVVHEGRILIGEDEQATYTQLTNWRAGDFSASELSAREISDDPRARGLPQG